RREIHPARSPLRARPRPSRSSRDNLDLGLDLADEAFDAGERPRERARAAAAGALIVDRELVAGEAEHVEVAAVALEIRPHLLVEDVVDLVEPRAVLLAHLCELRRRGGLRR